MKKLTTKQRDWIWKQHYECTGWMHDEDSLKSISRFWQILTANTAEDVCPECGGMGEIMYSPMPGRIEYEPCHRCNTAEVDCLVCREKLMYTDNQIALRKIEEYMAGVVDGRHHHLIQLIWWLQSEDKC